MLKNIFGQKIAFRNKKILQVILGQKKTDAL